MNLENSLWMGGILPGMTESTILNSFRFYNIFPTGIKLIKDKQKNKNKSYCFISFKSFQEASNVLQYLNGKRIPNSEINFNLNWADYQGAKTAYVGNLNLNVTKEDLFSFFKMRYKSVQNARVIYGDNGISRGFGFVVFKNEDEYLKCLKEMNGVNFFGNIIKVKEQIRKEDNRKRNNNVDSDRISNNNVLIKKNTININDIIIQNNIINNNIINYNQNNMNMNMNINNNIENNNIKINGFNPINNRYENNNIISKIQSNKINNNNTERFSKIIEDNKSNIKSNPIFDDLINNINSSSIFLNINKNNKKPKTVENSNEQQLNNNKQHISEENMNKKKNLKLEVLEIRDEITLNKKIHESILKTLSYQKKLFIKEGIKFKSK